MGYNFLYKGTWYQDKDKLFSIISSAVPFTRHKVNVIYIPKQQENARWDQFLTSETINNSIVTVQS